ncbi:MAG: tetratricopeptide repeat protein [Parvularculaceae bacterium]|nr:tetratricopeptide repeat protein [Parvularculaceae bacterium]
MNLAALFDRAVANHRAGSIDKAEALYREILKSAPDHPGALSNLGRIARVRGDIAEAIRLYRRAAENRSAPAETHFNLGNALRDSGALEEAAASYARALEISPALDKAREALARIDASASDPDALTRRANELFMSGDGDAAAALLQRAVALKPGDPTALQNLGYFYRSTGHYRRAIAAYDAAGELNDAPIIRVEIANCLINIGRPLDARRELEKLLATPQGRRAAASSYLMSLLYDPALSPQFVRSEHERLTDEWPLRAARPPRRNARKTLRVGYLTADFFGNHPVAQFLAPVIERHCAPEYSIESLAYDAKPRRDATAARMSALVATRSTEGLTDEEVADLVRRDGVDLLVDLSGHTSGRRLAVLGLAAAPSTACFIGYPSTTGYRGVDWLIGDDTLFPEGADSLYSEKLARLPRSFLCFTPPPGMPSPAPRRKNGPVLFGSLNHFPKINAGVVALWSRILREAPTSRLLLQCAAFAEPQTATAAAEQFAACGVARERLRLEAPQQFEAAMRRYLEIDIALDPFPYNGGTTTAHALYMGVPTVALEGRSFCGRMGASLLAAANRREWLAKDADSYVEIALDLAARIAAGEDIRRALIASNASAPLFDADAYARDVAALYRRIA